MNSLTHNIFGYGSLLWNPGFPYIQVRKVWLPGWSRRMWQGSTDHRGTPDFPGLVCTLVPEGGCWGLAYTVSESDWPEVRAQLDYREKDGYELRSVIARLQEEEIVCWTYVAEAHNPSYVGPRDTQELAWRISRARGESGHNIDYLVRLQQTLLALEIDDPHVTELIERLPGSLK